MIGKRLGHYEVTQKLGQGGMGEVYRAHDTKLQRDVAIKVLPVEMSGDPERLARFDREARALASLQHPNVASIYGIEEDGGTRFLVMELAEGEDLSERIQRGPMPPEKVQDVAQQLIAGLEAAHAVGVIHRDLKPANIKLSSDGTLKILDFGLARANASAGGPDSDIANSPTITAAMTGAGVILGTAAYMAPEQARGREVDQRADVWSFGVILFEMLTGRQLFTGETVSDTLAAVLRGDPDWNSLPETTDPGLRHVIRLCLQRKPAERLHSISDARVLLAQDPIAAVAAAEGGKGRRPVPWMWALLSALLLALAAMGWLRPSTRAPSGEVMRLSMLLPEGSELRADWSQQILAIDGDGKAVYYRTQRESDGTQDWIPVINRRALLDEGVSQIAEGDIGQSIFLSPDGSRIGRDGGSGLQHSASTGGHTVELDVLRGWTAGAAWLPDDTIVFPQGLGGGLARIPAGGGAVSIVTQPNREQGEVSHRHPFALPGGEAVLFTVKNDRLLHFADATIAAASLETGEVKYLLEGGMNPKYSPTGHLVYFTHGGLHTVGFDPERLEVFGSPTLVVPDVAYDSSSGSALYDFSPSGTLAYVRGGELRPQRTLLWLNEAGAVVDTVRSGTTDYLDAAVSPDGRFVVATIPAANNKLWILDLDRDLRTRLTFGAGNDASPIWSPDGKSVYFASDREGDPSVYRVDVSTGEETRVLPPGKTANPIAVSPDGETLVFASVAEAGDDLNLSWMRLDGSGNGDEFLQTEFDEPFAAFSRDGRWLAYLSNESGIYEIYLRRFPEGSRKIQVTSGGAAGIAWSGDGTEIFYPSLTEQAHLRISVEFGEDEAKIGRPREMFPFREDVWIVELSTVGPGFLGLTTNEGLVTDRIELVFDWFELLEERIR